ncbi:MAG: manganese catalase family protein [Halalkalicoccus sp.]|nr:manganese catalase family protein [Halalkalicoccus sp.]
MFYHDDELQYPVEVEEPDPAFARMLQQAIGGVEGEIRVFMQYLFQGMNQPPENERMRTLLYETAMEELGHVEMLATAVAKNLEGAPGDLRGEVERELRAAAEGFPDEFSRLVGETEKPFVQTIYDLSVPEMAVDRVCLLGDAAFVARPHTAAGTAKAAADAIDLGRALEGHAGLESALERWEEKRLAAGRRLVRKGIRMGEGYME